MKREDIERDLAQAEIDVGQATAYVERQREMLHYATRLDALAIIRLATLLLGKFEDNLFLKIEIRDRLKRRLAEAIKAESLEVS